MKIELSLTDLSKLAKNGGREASEDRDAITTLFRDGAQGDMIVMVPSADTRSKNVTGWYATKNGQIYATMQSYGRNGVAADGSVLWKRSATMVRRVVTREKLGDAFDTIPARLLVKVADGAEGFSFVAPIAVITLTKTDKAD